MTPRSEIRRLRREHQKAHRLWRITRKPTHYKALQKITTAIVAMTGSASASRSGRTLGTGAGQ